MAGMSVNAHPAVETLFPCRPAGIAQDLSRTYYVEHPQLNIFKKLPMEAYSWCTGNDLKGISIHLHRYATYHSAKSVRIESPYTAVARTRFIEQLNDGRRIKVLQPGNIFLTAKQVAAQCNLLVFIPGRKQAVMPNPHKHYAFKQLLDTCHAKEWIPYCKKPFHGAESVIQAVMPNPHKTLWGYMHQKSPDEFLPGKSEFLPLSMVFVILNGKRNRGISDTLYAVVAYGNPVGIFAKISDDGLCTMKWLLTIRDPFFGMAGVQKLFKSNKFHCFVYLFSNGVIYPFDE